MPTSLASTCMRGARRGRLSLALILVGATACGLRARSSSPAAQTGAQPLVTGERCPSSPAIDALSPDDTSLVMLALGQQLCRDYRGGIRLFSTLLMCGTGHLQPCDPTQVASTNPVVPKAIAAAIRGAAGAPCFPMSCATKGSVVEINLTEPRIDGDSAAVTVLAIPTEDRTAATQYFERYLYVLHRVSPSTSAWRVSSRLWAGSGDYRLR